MMAGNSMPKLGEGRKERRGNQDGEVLGWTQTDREHGEPRQARETGRQGAVSERVQREWWRLRRSDYI